MEQTLNLLAQARELINAGPNDSRLYDKIDLLRQQAPEKYRWMFDDLGEAAAILAVR